MKQKDATEISTRDLILRESSRLFAERGFHGTSTRDIAGAVGVRQPSLFHHFATKLDIMTELQQLEFSASLKLLTTTLTLEGSAAARLYFALFSEVHRLLSSPFVFTGTTAADVLNDPAFAEARADHERVQEAQTALITQGISSGELIDLDPVFANRAVEWTIEGVLVDALRDPDIDPDQFADLLASFAVRSLLDDTDRLSAVREEAMALIQTHHDASADPSTSPDC